MSKSPSSAVKRLMRDWKEVLDYPLEYIYAQPYPIMNNGQVEGYDMYNWFATLLVPESVSTCTAISLTLTFNDNYPIVPPNVKCLSVIAHPHVFGSYICLDMLSVPYKYNGTWDSWSAWSSTYSVLSILLQLESFLLDKYLYSKFSVIKNAEYKELIEMGHDPKNAKFWPWAPHWGSINSQIPTALKSSNEIGNTQILRTKSSKSKKININGSSTATLDVIQSEWKGASSTLEVLSSLKSNDNQFKGEKSSKTNTSIVMINGKPMEKITNTFGEVVLTQNQVMESLRHRASLLNVKPTEIVSYKDLKFNHRLDIMKLPPEIIREIFSYLDFSDLKSGVEQTCHYLKGIASSKAIIQERELICFHSKVTFKEDTLGIGLNVEVKPNGYVDNISSPMDLVSRNAFYNDNAVKSAWGIETKFWIPIFINKKHADFELFKSSVKAIYNAHPSITKEKSKTYSDLFNSPEVYIDLICKIMNSMIVDLMKGEVHASIKYLQGYLYFHRWLLYILEIFPFTTNAIERKVKNFVNREHLRNKYNCPNLGEFLILLSVLGPANLNWDSVKYAIVEETCTRNVLWAVKMFPELANLSIEQPKRIEKTWKANMVSCKLLMFHVFFLKTVIEKEHAGRSLDEVARLYDLNFGLSPETQDGQDLEELVQVAIFKNNNAQDFEEFLEYVGLDEQLNSREKILTFLEYCVKTSEQRRYHKVPPNK
ncbi:hypothetical protein NAEGRDRAFT_65426 [Naegleria gruberi]|uniref:Ubiquitin-conjugating enzyme family protein n=1 Tax=Naegleria gruberi TaxID=5762 RepID=D2V9F8_NAEGR|nr:uncharacterized protein NAEGRDRAFT_65426 [Naegleria gruberi]EFC46452.1 hypothetical protein NAEGRDRAFT_65426 [Naegleria gruberi]|eukprot:XP_002679196.1 hypothetical protein NAEGRDRAFT_65426 [Naegleria gruberi strain NEG-M]